MKIKFHFLLVALAFFACANRSDAQGTVFTYQGELQASGSPANGAYNFEFSLYTAQTGGTQNGLTQTNLNVGVTNGLFTTLIDFGPGIFTGATNWLQIGVETNTGGGGGFMTLGQRQELTPTPYAIFANTASNLAGQILTSQLSGVLSNANLSGLYSNAVTFSNSSDSFLGNGGGLTNLNASQLVSIGNTFGGTGDFFVGPSGNSQPSTSYDTALGVGALNDNMGDFNTAVGFAALYPNTTGAENSALGVVALDHNSVGSFNTAVGKGALYFNDTGSNNTALGFQAGYSNVYGNFDIYIGNEGLASDNNLIRIGTAGTHSNTYIAGVINGDGTDLSNLQVKASQLIVGSSFNLFVGAQSGNSTTYGGYNTVIGTDGLAANTSGTGNTVTGVFALQNNLAGNDNSAFGVGALNVSQNNGSNTAIGYNALQNFVNGSGNVALGYQAGNNLTNGANDIYIGNAGMTAENNTIRIGSTAIQTSTYLPGDVYISGNSNLVPAEALNLSANARLNDNNLYFRSNGDTNHGLGFFGTGSLNGNFAGTNVNGPVLWGQGGGVLGTYNGTQKVALYWTTSTVTVNGTFNNNSDRNLKENFAPVRPADILEKVATLPLCEWSYKDDSATRHIGPMAQDFYSEFNVGTDDRHIAPIDEGGVALAAIKGLNQKVEEKEARIQTQAHEIQNLKQQNDSLAERLTELEAAVKLLAAQK